MSLLKEISERLATPNGIRLYLFGSSTHGAPSPSDVDVLLVYSDGQLRAAHALASAIRCIPEYELYDVLALSDSEERELKFIESERAIHFWPPAAG